MEKVPAASVWYGSSIAHGTAGAPASSSESERTPLGRLPHTNSSETERHDHGAGPANELLAKSLEEEGERGAQVEALEVTAFKAEAPEVGAAPQLANGI